uniref:Adenylate kinase n=1 Tax=Timema cristinae TaxID=61476 RepID=A0A7R9DFC2_TIMCR|nr:unnamed protein product [Timema cristinae]
MELNNFYRNVMPVADYFDQRGMLYAVNGERNPSDVYKDFRSAVLRTLGMQEPVTASGPEQVTTASVEPELAPVLRPEGDPQPEYKVPVKGFPPVIWVIGGPGSNKAALCQKAVRQSTGWVHCSVGRMLRTTAETTDPRQSNDSQLVRAAITAGDMVPQTFVLQLVESQMRTNMSAQGILMDGFPRDMNQVSEFETKFKQQPSVILLDCSKLQLGRGRLDDSVAAFRHRLELFRELSLPMLKALDAENRLTIVDGDTDTAHGNKPAAAPNGHAYDATFLHDLDDEDEATLKVTHNTTSRRPAANGAANGAVFGADVPGRLVNGLGPPGRLSRDTIRDMYANVETYPADSQL